MTKNQPKNLEELIREIEKEFEERSGLGIVYSAVLISNPSELKNYLENIKSFLRQALIRVAKETARAGKVEEIKLVLDERCPFCEKPKWECESENAKDIEYEKRTLNFFGCHRITFNQAVSQQQKQLEEFLGKYYENNQKTSIRSI